MKNKCVPWIIEIYEKFIKKVYDNHRYNKIKKEITMSDENKKEKNEEEFIEINDPQADIEPIFSVLQGKENSQ